ncbi:hypothetical protein QYM36_011461, partial [Artemia franciscana]
EVKDTISKLQPGATDSDGIHSLMLKNLPDTFVELLTELFNRSVIESAIPSEWNKAIVIPLLKADHIQIEQLGLLPGRSTTDALVRLEHLTKLSFKKGKAVHVIFLDMDSAFDRVDVGQLIRKLSVLGLPDLLVNWIHQVLMGREVQASLGGCYSEFKRKAYDIGLPQGSVLSPLLFSVYCDDISLENVLGAELFLYADDIAVAVVGRDPLSLQSAPQRAVDMLSIWANSNTIVFSTHKSVSVFFYKMHNLAAFKPQMKLNGQWIVVAEQARFLGATSESKKGKDACTTCDENPDAESNAVNCDSVNAADLQARVDKTPEPLEPAITDVRGLDIKIKDTVKQSFSEFKEELKKDIDVKFMDIETRVSKLEQTSSTAADPALLQKPIDCR